MTEAEVTTVYDRFTVLAKRSVVAARDAADALGHEFIGTEHLLLGVAQTAGAGSEVLRAHGAGFEQVHAEVVRQHRARGAADGGPAPRARSAKDALSALGIDVDEIRRRADANFGSGAFKYPRPPFSLEAKKAVQASLRFAAEMGKQRIDTEHLLLGALDNGGESGATQALTALGVDTNHLHRSVFEARS